MTNPDLLTTRFRCKTSGGTRRGVLGAPPSSHGPEGLITYWYLGRAFNQEVDPDVMGLRPDMRNASSGIMAAPLAIAAPETGGWRDRDVVPAPMTYALHVLDAAHDVRGIRVTRETIGLRSKDRVQPVIDHRRGQPSTGHRADPRHRDLSRRCTSRLQAGRPATRSPGHAATAADHGLRCSSRPRWVAPS